MFEKRKEKAVPQRDVNELLDLCNAWLCVILRRLGEGQHRFTQQELKEGLGRLRLSISRENGDYILSLMTGASVPEEQEVNRGGDEA